MASSSQSPVHLVVLCHGLWGEPKHLHTLATLLCRSFGSRATILKGSGGRRTRRQVGPEDEEESDQYDDDDDDDDDDNHDNHDEGNQNASSPSTKSSTSLQFESIIKDFITPRKAEEQDMDVVILNSMSNKGSRTYDGIDWIAERVVREIKDEQGLFKRQSKYVARFSMIGYSLGGLVARYTIALLDSQKFFDSGEEGRTIQPRHFATFATPHIGVPPASGSFGKMANYIGGRFLSRTGEQLYLLDSGWETEKDMERNGKPERGGKKKVKVGLIECMARPNSSFLHALQRFKKITFYANAVNDITVPFRTGCIEEWDPFIGHAESIQLQLLKGTPLLLDVDTGTAPDQSRWQRIRGYKPTLPFFLNPRRLPFRAPYNYLALLGLPIFFPTILVLLLYRFSSESRKSRARIAELDRGWDLEEGVSKDGKPSRIQRLVRSVIISVGEDRVDEERSIIPSTPDRETIPTQVDVPVSRPVEDSARTEIANPSKRSPLATPPIRGKVKEAPLLPAQIRMVRALNDPKILPRLEKRWAYFDDVINCESFLSRREYCERCAGCH